MDENSQTWLRDKKIICKRRMGKAAVSFRRKDGHCAVLGLAEEVWGGGGDPGLRGS